MSTPGLSEFVDHLRMTRLGRRIQQQQVAERLSIGQSRLAQYEHHRHEPDTETLTRWADALDVELPEGLTGRIAPVAECGTPSGRGRHQRLREDPCEDCKRAWREYMNAYRRRVS